MNKAMPRNGKVDIKNDIKKIRNLTKKILNNVLSYDIDSILTDISYSQRQFLNECFRLYAPCLGADESTGIPKLYKPLPDGYGKFGKVREELSQELASIKDRNLLDDEEFNKLCHLIEANNANTALWGSINTSKLNGEFIE